MGKKNEGIPAGKIDESIYRKSFIRISLAVAHVFGIWGIALFYQGKVLLSTIIFSLILMQWSGIGLSMGAHRLWGHKSFKAKTPLKVLLAIGFSFSGQLSLWHWATNHRLHHKYSDTENDPHDPSRGFFHSHIGWALNYDHEMFRRNVKKIYIRDLEQDKVVMFHDKYALFLHIFCIWVLPTFVPFYFFGESPFSSFCVAANLRYMLDLHRIFLINSVGHKWGYKHFDTSIRPTNHPWLHFFTQGDGMHNHHHVFPWDYKTPEIGFIPWNFATWTIEIFAKIGWAYDLKTVSNLLMAKRAERTGDGSYNPDKHFSVCKDEKFSTWDGKS